MHILTRSYRSLRRTALSAFLAAGLLAAEAPAAPVTFVVAQGKETGVVFTSKAPLETFEGRTGLVDGWCRFDPADLAAGVELEIGVDLASFDTGLAKRNQHMRENHLETDRFPRASFRGGALVAGSAAATPGMLVAGQPITVTLHGTLDLHGVVKDVSVEVTLERRAAGPLSVSAAFPVALGDHAIERPRFLVMKLADEQMVRVQLRMEEQP